jgi:hypothetical protein
MLLLGCSETYLTAALRWPHPSIHQRRRRSILGSVVQRCPDDEQVTVGPRGSLPFAAPLEGCSQPGLGILLLKAIDTFVRHKSMSLRSVNSMSCETPNLHPEAR